MSKNKALDAEIYAVYDENDEKQFEKIFNAFLKRKVLLNCIAGNWMDRLNFNLVRPVIDRCDYVLFLVSEYSLASTINYAELSYAHAMDKPVYAIVVSDLGLDVDIDECDFAKHFVVDRDFEEDDPALNNAIDSIIADVMGQAQEKTVAEEYESEENGENEVENGGFEEVELVPYDPDGDNTELNEKLDEYFKALDAALKNEGICSDEQEKQENEEVGEYKAPPIEIFTTSFDKKEPSEEWKAKTVEIIKNAFEVCKIKAEFDCSFTGAQVTRFVFAVPENFVKDRLYMLADEVDNFLPTINGYAASGKTLVSALDSNYVGVDVPNPTKNFVSIGEALRSREFKQNVKPLAVPIGKDVYGDFLMADIENMPHLLVCGTSGSGKTELLNSIILSLVMKNSPDDLRFILVDPKIVELKAYDELPHVLGSRVINEPDEVLAAFKWLRNEMELRYKALAVHRINHISEYHEKRKEDPELAPIPYVVMIIDEYSEIMQNSDDKEKFEKEITFVLPKARAAGIHIIMSTQCATNQVVTGHIKSNFQTVAAMKVSSSINSRIAIDAAGAEQLCCSGDMLLTSQLSRDVERLQAPFCPIKEQLACISFIKENNQSMDSDSLSLGFASKMREEEKKREILERKEQEYRSRSGENDPLFKDVIRTFYKNDGASGAMIIRIFGVGYRRAVYMLDAAEKLEFIKRAADTGKIEVLVTPQSFMDYFGEDIDD